MTATEATVPIGANGAWVGRAMRRREDDRLVTGTGLFTDDATAEATLHVAILRSPHPHARIVSIDMTRARTMPGVALAISGAEAREHWEPLPPAFTVPGLVSPVVYGLAVDKATYEGEPIAVVAASDRYLAEDALEAIDVVYEVLEPVGIDEAAVDWETLSAPAPQLVYDDLPDNVQLRYAFSAGEVDAAFAQADQVVKARISVHRYGAVPLEPRAVFAQFDANTRRLTVRASIQAPQQMRSIYARVLRLPESAVRVVTGDVGGGFGGKTTADIEIIPILVAKLTGRPVKWAETREEWMLSGPVGSRSYVHFGELALRSDGSVLALRDRLLGDCSCDGLARGLGAGGLLVAANYGPGPYRIEAYDVKALGLLSNKSPYGSYRGMGKDIANQLIERLMDKGADALGIDRVEIRRRNLVTEFPYNVISGPVIEGGSFLTCLDTVTKKMDLPALRAEQVEARTNGKYLGTGIVSMLEPSGAAIPMSVFTGVESATVRLHPDGSATVMSGIQPIGQGIETTYTQVVAGALGITPDDIRLQWGDTDAVPFGLGSYGSRGAIFGASAAHLAATEVRRKMAVAAGVLLQTAAEDIDFRDGDVFVKESPDRKMTVAELAWATYYEPGPPALLYAEAAPTLEATSVYTAPEVRWVPDKNGGYNFYPAHGSGAVGCQVQVDTDTGMVTVQKVWVVHDAGRILNPAIVDNQILGSGVQAIGGALFEEMVYDSEGKLATRTLGDYQLPMITSIPDFDITHIESPSTIGALGAKGVGEGLHIGLGAALLSAVEDALAPFGVEALDTPLTPPRVLELLEGAARNGGVKRRGGPSPRPEARSA
jgi:carbon-monoxide dehydrogenase large subunit